MKKTRWTKRLLAGVLCTGLIFQNLPVNAFASEAVVEETASAEETLAIWEEGEEYPEEKESVREETAEQSKETAVTEEADTTAEMTTAEETGTTGDTTEETTVTEDVNTTEETTVTEDVDATEEPTVTEETDTIEDAKAAENEEFTKELAAEEESNTDEVLTLENNSYVEVKVTDRFQNWQWIAFTAPSDGRYLFYSEYDEYDYPNIDSMSGYLFSRKMSDEELNFDWIEDLDEWEYRDCLLAESRGGEGIIEYTLSQNQTVYLFMKVYMENCWASCDYRVYAKDQRDPIEVLAGNTYDITHVDRRFGQWLSFTAKRDGYYEISANNYKERNKPLFAVCESMEDYWYHFEREETLTFYAKSGKKYYIYAGLGYNSADDEDSYTVRLRALELKVTLTPDISRTTINLDLDTTDYISLTVYCKKSADTDWGGYPYGKIGYVTNSGSSSIVAKDLAPDTDYDFELRIEDGYINRETVVYRETVHTKAADYEYSSKKVNDYTVKYLTEPLFGGCSLITNLSKSGGTAEGVQVYIYLRENNRDWYLHSIKDKDDIRFGADKVWKISGLNFGESYAVGITIGAQKSNDNPVTELAEITVEMPKKLKNTAIYTGYRSILIKNDTWISIGGSIIQNGGLGKTYYLSSLGTPYNSGNHILYPFEIQSNSGDIDYSIPFDAKIRVSDDTENGYLIFKNLTWKQGSLESMAEQISVDTDQISVNSNSDGAIKMRIPVQAKELPEGNFTVKASIMNMGGYWGGSSNWRHSNCYNISRNQLTDVDMTVPVVGITGDLSLKLYEDCYLGMRADPGEGVLIAEIPIQQGIKMPNSSRTVTVNETKTEGLQTKVNITVGNIAVEDEKLFAYAQYWTVKDGEAQNVYETGYVALSSKNNYTGDIVFDVFESDTQYFYRIRIINQEWYIVNTEEEGSYTFEVNLADNFVTKFSATNTYAAGAELTVTAKEKIINSGQAVFSYREKGKEGEWNEIDSEEITVLKDGSAKAQIRYLLSGTAYEYKVSVVGKAFSEGVLTGEDTDVYKSFKTKTAADILANPTKIQVGADHASLTLSAKSDDKTVYAYLLVTYKDAEGEVQTVYHDWGGLLNLSAFKNLKV